MVGDGEDDGREEYRAELSRDLVYNAMELCVHVGLFNTVAGAWPPEVQENWMRKIQSQIEWITSEIVEVQGFAEFFDEED